MAIATVLGSGSLFVLLCAAVTTAFDGSDLMMFLRYAILPGAALWLAGVCVTGAAFTAHLVASGHRGTSPSAVTEWIRPDVDRRLLGIPAGLLAIVSLPLAVLIGMLVSAISPSIPTLTFTVQVPPGPRQQTPVEGFAWHEYSIGAYTLTADARCSGGDPKFLGFRDPFARLHLRMFEGGIAGTPAVPSGLSAPEVDAYLESLGRKPPKPVNLFPYEPRPRWLPEGHVVRTGTQSFLLWRVVGIDLLLVVAYAALLLPLACFVRSLFTTRAERGRIRLAKGLCPRCRYPIDLEHMTKCPECGAPLPSTTLSTSTSVAALQP